MKTGKKNILIVCETSGTGGAETVVLRLATGIDRRRYSIRACLFRDGWLREKLEAGDVETTVLKTTRGYDIGLIIGLRRQIKSKEIDLIHSHLPDANAYSVMAAKLARVPCIVTYHGNVNSVSGPADSGGAKLALVRLLASRAVAVSDHLKNNYLISAGFDPKKTERIYNGVDWSKYDSEFDRSSKRQSVGYSPDDQIVGIVANLRPAKGYEYFIDAAARIAKHLPNARFLVVGHEKEEIKGRLTEQLDKLGISDRLQFLGFREDVPDLIRCFDLFMLSSVTEGLSIATIEAMGAGVPVVVTASGGPEEIVQDGVTGCIVPIRDSAALASRAIELLTDHDLARRMAEKAKETARSRFGLHEMIESYQKLYDRCIC